MRLERHNAILKVISEKDIETQAELLSELQNMGVEVTQATISRDIKELRLIKTLTENGKYKYTQSIAANAANMNERFLIIFSQSVTSIDYAMNNVVIKTLPGMAQAAAAALDYMEFAEIVGSLAGDDTVFLVVRSEVTARALVYKLRNMLERGRSNIEERGHGTNQK